jgi:hypothetical protein
MASVAVGLSYVGRPCRPRDQTTRQEAQSPKVAGGLVIETHCLPSLRWQQMTNDQSASMEAGRSDIAAESFTAIASI